MKPQSALLVRASISFPASIYQNLKNLAKQKKVSLAWVVREAAESYIADETAQGRAGQKATIRAVGKAKG